MCAVVSQAQAGTVLQFLQSRDLMVLNHNEGLDSASLMFLNVTGDEEETLDSNSRKLELYLSESNPNLSEHS